MKSIMISKFQIENNITTWIMVICDMRGESIIRWLQESEHSLKQNTYMDYQNAKAPFFLKNLKMLTLIVCLRATSLLLRFLTREANMVVSLTSQVTQKHLIHHCSGSILLTHGLILSLRVQTRCSQTLLVSQVKLNS